jgi:AraC family transcriptional regulator
MGHMGKRVNRECEIAGLTVAENHYPPSLRQPAHRHQLASLSFVLAGSYLERCGRQGLTRRASTLILRPPQECHAVDYHDEVRILSVQIDSSRLAHIREHSAVMESTASFRSERIARLGRLIYQEFRRGDAASALSIEGLVLELVAEASRAGADGPQGRPPGWLGRAEEFLRSNISKPVALGDLAAIAGVHPVHLARVFRRQKGCTVGEYVRRLRVDFALRQLSETENSLSDIAAAAGFADHSHLTRTFKAHTGLTPSAYRKNSRWR